MRLERAADETGSRWNGIRALLVGCGSIGRRHARVLKRLGVGQLLAFDPLPAQAQRLASEVPGVKVVANLEEGLDAGPDAVWILSPPQFHVAQAQAALEAGAHFFCEKPLTDRPATVGDLADRLEHSGLCGMVGLCFRFHEGLRRARQMLQAGDIGRLVSIRGLMGEPIRDIRPDYRQVWGESSNGWGVFDLIHDIDLAIWFADAPVTAVQSIFGSFSDIGLTTPDLVELIMQFQSRCTASVHLDFFQQPRRRQLDLLGTTGTIIVEFGSWDRCTLSLWRRSVGDWETQTIPTRRDDMFLAQNTAFLRSAFDGEPLQCSLSDAMQSVLVVDSVLRQRAQPNGHELALPLAAT